LVDGLEKLSHLIKKQGVQKQEKTLGDTIWRYHPHFSLSHIHVRIVTIYM
jgi:hypothetical protein